MKGEIEEAPVRSEIGTLPSADGNARVGSACIDPKRPSVRLSDSTELVEVSRRSPNRICSACPLPRNTPTLRNLPL
jgi:hypothetical protein